MGTCDDWKDRKGCGKVIYWGQHPTKPNKAKFEDADCTILHDCPNYKKEPKNPQPRKDATKTMVTSHANHIVNELDTFMVTYFKTMAENITSQHDELKESNGKLQEIVVNSFATLMKDILTMKKQIAELYKGVDK